MIKTNSKMNKSVKELLKLRGDDISLYALKRIEELEQNNMEVKNIHEHAGWVESYMNEPKIGDTVIMWNAENPKESATIDTLGKITETPRLTRYYGWANVTNSCIKWDGTKEQFDRIRNKNKAI